MGFPTTQCPFCHALRAVKDWHEHRETLQIELEPCGHVIQRNARLEWRVDRAAA